VNFLVEKILVTKISGEYSIIINPFGEIYPEESRANLLSLKRIMKYIEEGGVFVNVAGLAFYYSWDGKESDLTGPPYETYRLREGGILERVVLLCMSYLTDTMFYRLTKVRTTFFNPTVLTVYPISDKYFNEIDKVGGDIKVLEFRSAFRSEGNNELIPLLVAKHRIVAQQGESIFLQCYPIAAVRCGLGYLVLIGMKLEKRRKQDFEKVIKTIECIVNKLHRVGKL